MHSGMQSTPVNHVAKTGHPPELLDKKKKPPPPDRGGGGLQSGKIPDQHHLTNSHKSKKGRPKMMLNPRAAMKQDL